MTDVLTSVLMGESTGERGVPNAQCRRPVRKLPGHWALGTLHSLMIAALSLLPSFLVAQDQPGKAIYERAHATLREALGPEQLDALLVAGRQLPRDELGTLVAPSAALSSLSNAGKSQPNTGQSSDTHGLTDREVEVVQLAALGLSDAEIAARLFISPRTVSRHLLSAYRKLNVRTRTAAGAAAAALGILDRPAP